jgi:23S rRNA (cytidine1920-2'-O)/16S rRNA (cytidine1409-2'-O)-methyltransferase
MGRLKLSPKILKMRLDHIILNRKLVVSQQQAQAMIMAGEICVDGRSVTKPGAMIPANAKIEILHIGEKYASRAGMKLEGALEDFHIPAEGCICLDVGASTGGFTDCLLQHGARRVYAVDVNTAQLDWKLQRDSRLVAIKKNARYLKPNDIPEPADLVTVDVSFISAAKIIPAVAALGKPGALFLILVKPQFELPKNLVGKGGIVRDPHLHESAIAGVRTAAERAGLEFCSVKPSHLAGAQGNQEFFLHARRAR